tara:strand:+ start:659 stop:946 length:288 start_codon:yes stop_codon:yes gene_type:complete
MKNLSQAYQTVLSGKNFTYSVSDRKENFESDFREHLASQDVLEMSQIKNQETFDSYLSQFIFENSEKLSQLGFGFQIEKSVVFDDVIFFTIIEKI